jgi:hypothetical protein
MSLAKTGPIMRSMRIIALPLARPRRTTATPLNAPGNTNQPADAVLTYYHFQMAQKHARTGGLVNWASGKAADIWVNFGSAAEGTWRVCCAKLREYWPFLTGLTRRITCSIQYTSTASAWWIGSTSRNFLSRPSIQPWALLFQGLRQLAKRVRRIQKYSCYRM